MEEGSSLPEGWQNPPAPEENPKDDLLLTCEICGKQFKGKQGLGRHQTATHGMTPKRKRKPKKTLMNEKAVEQAVTAKVERFGLASASFVADAVAFRRKVRHELDSTPVTNKAHRLWLFELLLALDPYTVDTKLEIR